MSKIEIIAQLPRLSPEDRTEIWEQLWKIEDRSPATETEKLILDEAQSAYNHRPDQDSAWEDVEARLRQIR